MTVLVTGATGAVGRQVVAGLLAEGESVRALTRNPTRAALPAAVEIVGGDLADRATLTRDLFAQVDRMVVFPADVGVGDLVDSACAAGIDRFVVMSSLSAALENARDIGSASAEHHLAVEKAVTTRTDGWVIVRPGSFAKNLLPWADTISKGLPIRTPYPESAQAPIHEADIADVIVATLRDFEGRRGRTFAITGPRTWTRREQAAAVGRAVGVDIEIVEITPAQFREESAQRLPEHVVTMLLNYWRDTATRPERVRPIGGLCGHSGRTIAEWARDHHHEFAPGLDPGRKS